MKTFEIKKPSTIRVSFAQNMPLRFEVRNDKGKLFLFRELGGKFHKIKFNLIDKGIYKCSDECSSIVISPIEIKPIAAPLPKAVRNFDPPEMITVNEQLTSTPARIFPKQKRIEVSRKFLSYPRPVQQFILDHEEGHTLYSDENDADHYALKKYIERGGNNSMAYFTLKNVLHPSPQNEIRINNLLKKLNYEIE